MNKINFISEYDKPTEVNIYMDTVKLVSNTTELLIIEVLNKLAVINNEHTRLFLLDRAIVKNFLDITGIKDKPGFTNVLKKMAAKGLIELAVGNADGCESKGGRMVFARSIVDSARDGRFCKLKFSKVMPQTYGTPKDKRDALVCNLSGIDLCLYSVIYSESITIPATLRAKCIKYGQSCSGWDNSFDIKRLEYWVPEKRRAIASSLARLAEINLVYLSKNYYYTGNSYTIHVEAMPIEQFKTENLEKLGKLEAVKNAIGEIKKKNK